MEQYYPLPVDQLNAVLSRYPGAEVVWVQEEPENQGAWPFLLQELVKHLQGRTLGVVSRPAAASTAAGSTKVSAAQQQVLIEQALTL
jgi:2-oxoglutarate dehydrogenase E1 component